ncbi:MAG: polyprenyl diphosphate synthase [Myxococcales bacterium]|nr:polyprenyl diphosphate synthase [Myxococcales bacterium]
MTSTLQSSQPLHVAIIMDGNGRWAQARGLPRQEGHRVGAEAVRRIVREARRLGIRALTLYAFSEQNWQRPSIEVQSLMALLQDFLLAEREELLENGIRLRGIGRRERLPAPIAASLAHLEQETASLEGMTLSLALSYGGREEIVDAARALATEVQSGALLPAQIDEARFESALVSGHAGPVDLLIRTGGERRLSNFLLWGSAYAELFFVETLWPDLQAEDLRGIVEAFARRDRRFGGVGGVSDLLGIGS